MSGNVTLPKFRAKKYHRRSFWACDECKLRKKKCDGVQPCATCTLYGKGSKDCTYDSKTRPSQPATHRIRELEDDVRAVRALLSEVREELSGEALTKVDAMLTKLRPAAEESSQTSSPTTTDKPNVEGLRSMLPVNDRILYGASRSLCYGPYSGPTMILAILEFFQPSQVDSLVPDVINMFNADSTVLPPLKAFSSEKKNELVSESEAFELLSVVFMQTHPFLRSIDTAYVHGVFEKVYRDVAGQWESVDDASVSLCHMVLALGNLLSVAHHRRTGCEAAVSKAKSHFEEACRLIQITKCHDMISLQCLILASTFLIFISRLSSAYNFIGLAASSAAQIGLLSDHMPAAPCRSRLEYRTIVTLINIDLYLSTVLGLPAAIGSDSAENNVNEQPTELLIAQSHSPRPSSYDQDTLQSFDVLKRHFDVLQLTTLTLRSFRDSIAARNHVSSQPVFIDEAVLRKAVRELANLSKEAGSPLSPSAGDVKSSTSSSVERSSSDFAIYWSQLSMNMPFLHYLRPLADGQPMPDSITRPALTCLKIAVTVIVRCEVLLRSLTDSDAYSQFMHPGNWTCIYTIFLAVVALVFLISIHEGTSKPSEAWRKADSGIRILTALRCGDRGAAPCLEVIKKLVHELNYTVDFDFDNIEKTTRRVCERQTKLPTLSNILGSPLSQTAWTSPREGLNASHQSTRGSRPVAISSADKLLALAQSLLLKTDPISSETEDIE